MNKTSRNLEIGHRSSGIVKSPITDFLIFDFTISAPTRRSSSEATS